jgi:ATP phosphoribosyltransferase regulatory subunit
MISYGSAFATSIYQTKLEISPPLRGTFSGGVPVEAKDPETSGTISPLGGSPLKKTPFGCRNLSGSLAGSVETVRRAFLDRFASFGYRPFASSGLQLLEEAYDVLPPSLRTRLLPLASPGGEPCVLRADITLAAIGHLSSRHAPEERPLRLAYADRIYSVPVPPEERAERFQVGAELLGWEGEGADAEVIYLLLSTLDELGLTDSLVVLGDASLLSRCLSGLPSPLARSLSDSLRRGDLVGYGEALKDRRLPEEARTALSALPWTRGAPESVAENRGALRPEALLGIAETLKRLGYGDRIRIDLGLCRELDYYSGPIFEVYASPAGPALGGGGRYDGLLERLGLMGQAVGFALDLALLADSLPRERGGERTVLLAGGLPSEEVLRLAERITRAGTPLEISWREDRASSLEWARLRGAHRVVDPVGGRVRSLSGGREEGLEDWIAGLAGGTW